MEGFKWPCSHVWYLYNVFNLVLFGFWVTNAVFGPWLSIYIERAADDEMCIYCLAVNTYFSFHFFLYFCHCSFYKCGIKGKFWNFSCRVTFLKLENFHSFVKYNKYTFKEKMAKKKSFWKYLITHLLKYSISVTCWGQIFVKQCISRLKTS